MSDVAPKANRRWIIVPWALFLVALVGWSAWWMVSARAVGQRMDSEAQALRGKGYGIAWKSRSIGGYPFRYYVKVEGAQLTAPDGWGLSAPALEAESSAITPGVVVFVAPQGFGLAQPGKPVLAVSGEVLRMSLSGLNKSPPKIVLEGQKVRLMPASGAEATFPAIDRFEARLEPLDQGKAGLFFRIDKATPRSDSLLARVAHDATVTLDVEGNLLQPAGLSGDSPTRALDHWLTGGGRFEITQGGLAVGDSPLINLKSSTLSTDPDGRLNGKLRLSTDKLGEAMVALGEINVLPPETAAVAAGMSEQNQALLSLAGEASITLQFRDGKTYASSLELGPAPRVFAAPETPPSQ